MGWFWSRKFFDATLHEDVEHAYQAVSIDEQRRKFPPSLWREPAGQNRITQVWFAGVHSDVGGWYREAGLSDIALKWMLKSASAKDLRLKAGWEEGLKPDPLGRIHESRTGFLASVAAGAAGDPRGRTNSPKRDRTHGAGASGVRAEQYAGVVRSGVLMDGRA